MKLKPPQFDRHLVEEIEAYLDQPYQTEIVETERMGHPDDGLVVVFARGVRPTGRPGSRLLTNHARPMFQVIPNQGYSGTPTRPLNPCADCYDFSRSWNCKLHPERSYDTEAHQWEAPEPWSPPAAPIIDRMLAQFQQAVDAQADRARQMWETRPMPVQPLIDRLMNIDHVPFQLLPDTEIEVTGETVQGDGITIRFQAVRRDR